MEDVRVPQQRISARILLTLHHHNYGLQPLNAGQSSNPFEVSIMTWLRVMSESIDFDASCR